MNGRLATIRQKLFQLIEADKNFKIFGSNEPWNGHQYILNPTLNEEELTDFEVYVNVTLPGEYRSFLHEIADGGAGPFYGLFSLNDGAMKFGLEEDSTHQDYINRFKDFPVTTREAKHFVHNLSKLSKDPKTYFDRDDYPESISFMTPLIENEWVGALCLSHYGCGGYYALIVKGECYGQVWYAAEEGCLAPLCDERGAIFTFFDWYEYWLDKSLQQVKEQNA